jgi:hypothetical protein
METLFNRTLGHDDAKAFLARALSSGKFPHALLIHGPQGIGQNALALDLVDLLLCDDAARRPCGKCAGCLGRRRSNLENLHFVIPLEEKSEGGDSRALTGAQVAELTEGMAAVSADPYGFAPAEKAVIRIAQISDLQGKIGYTLPGGGAKVAVMLKAETMDAPVANALLKTLEEPPANTYFLIACEDRGSLLPTIVSRCTQLPLFPLTVPAMRAAAAARATAWDMPAVPERLLPLAEGSPGILLSLHRNGGATQISEAGNFLAAALGPDSARENGLPFADYLDGSPAFEDLASAAAFLAFLLRVIRLGLRLRIEAGAPHGSPHGSPVASAPPGARKPGAWTRSALAAQGLDPALEEALAPLEEAHDLRPLAAWAEELLQAVRAYAKPKNAAFGLYLEFLQKHMAERAGTGTGTGTGAPVASGAA